jgi:CheY-like chemotaxis protein
VGVDHKALETADSAAALRILQSPQRVDLLVSDIGLPGLNGRQLADDARVTRPGLKVLFVTGYAEDAAGNAFLEPGMEIVIKPFTMEALASKIREMIEDPL